MAPSIARSEAPLSPIRAIPGKTISPPMSDRPATCESVSLQSASDIGGPQSPATAGSRFEIGLQDRQRLFPGDFDHRSERRCDPGRRLQQDVVVEHGRDPVDQRCEIADALAGQGLCEAVHVRHDVDSELRFGLRFFQRVPRLADEIVHDLAFEFDPLAESILPDPSGSRRCRIETSGKRPDRLLKLRERRRIETRIERPRSPRPKLDFPVKRPARKIEKNAVHGVGPRNRLDFRKRLLLAPAVRRRHADIPLHLRAALSVLEDRP